MQTLTPKEQALSLAKSRADLADLILKDAQRESNSLGTRYSCAFDALYLYGLAAIQAPADLPSHPYESLLLAGTRQLELDMRLIEPVAQQMNSADTFLEAPQEQVESLISLAMTAQQALHKQHPFNNRSNTDDFNTPRP